MWLMLPIQTHEPTPKLTARRSTKPTLKLSHIISARMQRHCFKTTKRTMMMKSIPTLTPRSHIQMKKMRNTLMHTAVKSTRYWLAETNLMPNPKSH